MTDVPAGQAEAKAQPVAEAARRPRHQKKVKLCDLASLLSRKEEVKKKLKEMTKELKIQVQKEAAPEKGRQPGRGGFGFAGTGKREEEERTSRSKEL